jgi:hypothetical protein
VNAPARNRREFLFAGALLPWCLGARRSAARAEERVRVTDQALADSELTEWITSQSALSVQHLLRNVSPASPIERTVASVHVAPDRLELARREAERPGGLIRFAGGSVIQRIRPRPGSVAAAAMGKPGEPDYSLSLGARQRARDAYAGHARGCEPGDRSRSLRATAH